MSFKCGIVGLPNVGKSTLFNALTNSSKAQAENFPFCTIDPNIGVVPVPDDRLDQLVKISDSKKKINTTISFVDIAGLVKGASKGEGLGNKFLSHIREVDSNIHMIRIKVGLCSTLEPKEVNNPGKILIKSAKSKHFSPHWAKALTISLSAAPLLIAEL